MEEHRDESKFNAGIAKLVRMDKLRSDIHKCRFEEDFPGWLSNLESWFSEMDERLKTLEGDIVQAYFRLIKLLIRSAQETARIKKYGSQKDTIRYDGTFIRYMNDLERYLGHVERKAGFGMPDKEGAADAATQ